MSAALPATVSILTPPGRGAVAVITVQGTRALELVERFFHPASGSTLSQRLIGRTTYGRWGTAPAEDVIACRLSDGSVEIHCHGGIAAPARIVADLNAAGAVERPWTAWLAERELSPTRAAAAIALPQAITERTALILLDQFHGALERAVEKVVASIDAGDLECAAGSLTELIARAATGVHLTRPWNVVIAGPPNVGKSSLVNALLGYQRAIVFEQPGTTRDVVTALTALDGWPVTLSDTAGLRATCDPMEAAGIDRAQVRAAAADCLVLVFDLSAPWTESEQRLMESWPKAIVVHNKSDLAGPGGQPAGLATSAVLGQGVDALTRRIVDQLVPTPPNVGDAVPFTDEQAAVLHRAAADLAAKRPAATRASLLALLPATM